MAEFLSASARSRAGREGEGRRGREPLRDDVASRVLAQFWRIDPAVRSRSWAIALARMEGGLSFHGAGVTFFVFGDLSTIYLESEGIRHGGSQPSDFFDRPFGERVFL